jgi:hypothetical protein
MVSLSVPSSNGEASPPKQLRIREFRRLRREHERLEGDDDAVVAG